MGGYIPSSSEEQQAMLSSIGLSSFGELYRDVPEELRVRSLNLPAGKSEFELREALTAMAGKNHVFSSIFRGAGAYHHYIPAIVKSVTAKEEFLTAYTPYQAEISQGLLQSIFEYQTMICELTGMDVSNASVYDGASAAAEAVAMCRERKRTKALVASTAHPMVIETIKTYCRGAGTEVEVIGQRNGRLDLEALSSHLDAGSACVYIQQPNFYGQLEDAEAVGLLAHQAGAKYVMGVNPISLAVLKSPKSCGADIAVGEGQPLGLPLSFGGPYLGFMACPSAMMRRLPGRIVGETADSGGRRAFVLTLQAREQHIRREKASSNICSNQALCALTAAVYLSAMGPKGLAKAAAQCYSKAHYAAAQLAAIPGIALPHPGEFFHEFVTELPIPADVLLRRLEAQDILGGYPIHDRALLWCVTEVNTKAQIDAMVNLVKEVCMA